MQADGVHLAGRLTAADGQQVRFAPDLPATIADADRRMRRLLGTIDRHIQTHGRRHEVLQPEPQRAVAPTRMVHDLDLRAAGIRTIVWATGHRSAYAVRPKQCPLYPPRQEYFG